jgi:hypothetical protein
VIPSKEWKPPDPNAGSGARGVRLDEAARRGDREASTASEVISVRALASRPSLSPATTESTEVPDITKGSETLSMVVEVLRLLAGGKAGNAPN